ncbi:hypothetical protein [Owenweeksia hongkongensis]|uniref:hypothetical protein n=1 Tax=Owenweeksia hongkongensis TaxID=253245 RepID=UPI003A8CAD0F
MKKQLFTAVLMAASFITVAQSGNVGVGTSSPQAKLHVQGDLRVDSLKAIDYSKYNLVLDSASKKVAIQLIRSNRDTLVRIYAKTGGNSVPHLTATRIVWSGTDINTVPSAWDASTGIFTAPHKGFYRISTNLTFNPNTGNNAQHTVIVRKNGADFAAAGNFDSSGGGSIYKPAGSLSTMVELNAGETVSVWAFQGVGSTQTLYNSVWNFLSIEELP